MKRAGFTMIELIFVIVILGILGAVAIPKLSAVKDDAQLANANENICVNLKGPLLSYAVRHNGSLVDANLSDYSELTGWTVNGSAVLVIGTNLTEVADSTALSGHYAVSNPTNHVYVYLVDGNNSVPYGCYVGNKATYNTTAAGTRTLRDSGSNYL